MTKFLIKQIAATIMLDILIHLCDSKITRYRNDMKKNVTVQKQELISHLLYH